MAAATKENAREAIMLAAREAAMARGYSGRVSQPAETVEKGLREIGGADGW